MPPLDSVQALNKLLNAGVTRSLILHGLTRVKDASTKVMTELTLPQLQSRPTTLMSMMPANAQVAALTTKSASE